MKIVTRWVHRDREPVRRGRARHSVRAAAWQLANGAHGVTRPTLSFIESTVRGRRQPMFEHSRLLIWLMIAGVVAGLNSKTLGQTSASHSTASTNHVLHPALEMSLFAAEPDVVDPVALTFDEAGRMYVVEMRDYPYGVGPE